MKKRSDLKLTQDTFRRAPVLRELMNKAELHQQAEAVVLSALPDHLALGARFVACHEGEMVLSAETSGAASQIRFRQHEIMERLRNEELFRFVWKLKVKVAPARFRNKSKFKKAPLSNENARLLKEEAGHTKDKQLREVLEKLASHVRD